jgi:hypothetical protein
MRVKRRKKLTGPRLTVEWVKEYEMLPSQPAHGRNCPCGGSNENCCLCNGLGVITSTPYTAPLGIPKADFRVCDKCEFEVRLPS